MITSKDQQLFPNPESFRGIHLKKTMKDRCMVIGETTMYYSNAGSVQVLSPIPVSPTMDSEPWSDYTRPDSPRKASLVSLDSKDKVKKKTAGKKIASKKTTKRSEYTLPPIKNVPSTVLSKKTADGKEKIEASSEPSKPINMPSFRAGRRMKTVTKGSNPSVPGHESVKRTQATSCRSSALSVEIVRLPVPRGARRTSTSVKFLPPLYTDGLPSLRVHAMVAQ